MGEFKIPIEIDGFRCVEDMAQAVLGYTYKGKTLKEWADSISEPASKADQIRTMTDQELAEWIGCFLRNCIFIFKAPCLTLFQRTLQMPDFADCL